RCGRPLALALRVLRGRIRAGRCCGELSAVAQPGPALSAGRAAVLETRVRDRDPVPRRAGKPAAQARPPARAARVRPRAGPPALGVFAAQAPRAAPPAAHTARLHSAL